MKKIICTIFTFLFLSSVSGNLLNAQSPLKEETRFPWGTATGGFIQDWLVIGGFPNRDGKGFDNDYLQENQGEQLIKPVEGMKHKTPNGSSFEWKKYHSPYNYISFFDILKGTDFNNKVCYAFKKINRSADGKVILSFGHNVGNKIWINGKQIYANRNDYASGENNHLEVDMVKGENSILVKSVHGGWTWGFWMRIIEPEQFSLIHDFQLSPSIIDAKVENELVLKTDRTLNPEIQKMDVLVEVVEAGGEVADDKTIKRGDVVNFDTEDWDDGVYDIRFTSNNNKGEIVAAYLLWYKGDAAKKAKEIVNSAPEKPKTPNDYLHVMLKELIYDRAGNDLNKIDSSNIERLYPALMEYEELVNNSAVRANGFVRLAYIDEVDNTPQFCRAYLPMDYDPDKKWPLVVNLHGYNGANPTYVKWWSIDSRHTNLVDKFPVIDIEPHGRGNTSYNGIGELDVLRCIEMAKKMFNVDEDRIYLKGESMGGGGTWNVGTRNPGVFAAIAPVYGGWDYHTDLSEEQLAKLSERERFNREKSSNFAQADALLTTPVFVSHGDIDASVDVKYSRYGVQLLQRWGYDIRYHEYPGYGHEGMPYVDEVISWFLEHKRNSNPEKVRVRSAYLRSASAHWVKVTQRENPYAFIEAEAEILLDNTIKLFTENVLEIELTPSNKLINPKKPIKVIWNVSDIREVKPENGKIVLQHKDYKPGQLVKTPKIEGLTSHLTTTPFAVVIGTTSTDSLMKKMCRQKAQEFIDYWKTWQKYEPRVFMDTELSETDMKKFSLILYGDASANLITKKMSAGIPLKVSPDEIEIAGKKFQAKDACVQMIYPHPYNSERYVSVIGATSGAGMFFYNTRSDDYDFLIMDGCIPNNRMGRPMDKLYIARGIFNNHWQINENLLETGDNEIRKNCPVREVLPDLTVTVANLPEFDVSVYQSLVGKYDAGGATLDVYIENGVLMGKSPDGNIFKLLPASKTDYFVDVVDIQLSFSMNDNGTADYVVAYVSGQEYRLMKMK